MSLGFLSPGEQRGFENTVREAYPLTTFVSYPAQRGVTLAMFAEAGREGERQSSASIFNCYVSAATLLLWPCVSAENWTIIHFVLYDQQQVMAHGRYAMRATRVMWLPAGLALPFLGDRATDKEVAAITRDFLSTREALIHALLAAQAEGGRDR